MLSRLSDAEAAAAHKRLRRAENLYLKAAKAAGNKHLQRLLLANREEDENANEHISENMSVSGGEVRYSFKNSNNGLANDGLIGYSGELRDLIEERGDIIIDSYNKLVDIVNLAFDEPSTKKTVYFGIIDTATLVKIKNSIPNLPRELEGKLFKEGKRYSVAATLDSIRHLVDEKSLTREDVIDYLDRFADTILEFDSTMFDYYADSYKNKVPGILFKKTFEDGTLVSFDIVSHKKRSISLQTLYMESADYQKKKSPKTLPLSNDHSHTPEVRAGKTSSIGSITDFSEKVNSDTKFSYKSPAESKTANEHISENMKVSYLDADSEIRYNFKGRNYTDQEYRDFGWARANDVLTASESERLRTLFAEAVTKQSNPPKTKSGEYMIAVGDFADNKIVYMRGEIDSPMITRVLEINEYNETKLDELRRETYAIERRGIQREAGELFNTYTATSFRSSIIEQNGGVQSQRHNNKLGIVGRGSSKATSRIKEILFDDGGNVISETRYSYKSPAESKVYQHIASRAHRHTASRAHRHIANRAHQHIANRAHHHTAH